jgi:hypothetical protein
MSFSACTRRVRDGVRFSGWRVIGERLLADGEGGLMWLIGPPERRTWRRPDVLGPYERPGWTLEQADDGALLRCEAGDAELDTLEMHGPVARAFEADRSEPLTVIPTFRALRGPHGLSEHLVGGHVLSGGPKGRWPSDQVALSLYRIARWRSGPFWDSVAGHIADVSARRIEQASGGRPVSDIWSSGEVHSRYLADAALLVSAHAALTAAPRFEAAAERAADGLASFGTAYANGCWYLHDSLEQDAARNDLVLNTHLHALTALHACGRPIAQGQSALEAVLARRTRGARALRAGLGLVVSERALAHRATRMGHRIAERAQLAAARAAHETGSLRLPGGYVARDLSGARAPRYYLTVNVGDLAVAQRNFPSPMAGRALDGALRFLARSGFVRADARSGSGTLTMLPAALRNADCADAARRAAEAARAAGFAPAIGWPEYEDSLWPRLARGTP